MDAMGKLATENTTEITPSLVADRFGIFPTKNHRNFLVNGEKLFHLARISQFGIFLFYMGSFSGELCETSEGEILVTSFWE